VIRAELPGVDPKDVDVSVAGRNLTIKGERKAPEVPRDDRLFSEIVYGRFERTVTVPEGLNDDRIKAVWHNGMLEITIPVSQLQPKKVPVEIVGGAGSKVPLPVAGPESSKVVMSERR